MEFSKGHGTENDFVVLPDPDGSLDLTPERVAALCDRRRGLGADGVLRVVRWAALGDGPPPEPGVEWFMDYRNADGSLAEMCGNGVRVYARYLAHRGWLSGDELALGTRGGVRTVRLDGDEVSVDMGPAAVGESTTASVDGQAFGGITVDVGNPHLACVTDVPVDHLDLTRPPGHDPALFPHGVNVEFVTPVDESDEVVMRVHERGVGETRSCGTGTVAAVVAALRHAGRETGTVGVSTPGGRLRVTVTGTTTVLHGPAVLVAHGDLDWESLA
ncbi:diaminopimelate epimerase [Pseudonocardia sp. KRD-184]|uniref:Diaminopimelate epimerase n=1 Tax=Pseudonocardia oceani TaxID=2792013 RepID=A0ABS6U4H4_9PSEU|nr:diaminopimelate epimerase [Pseudonocardia oceani]MBW0092761.1 diaminopimelate epimerase [Pseudonocardia oceani]MBW0096148.1 diaminopimelate epimerase [Pseudonocardia oceani]MBW0125558.1 diaminopimelate epimerase [Pseudonocardia oceani]MBW0127127.1 diaminopimelate epimerase [Pseudonocardia oceani]